jgi:hypothetical protein
MMTGRLVPCRPCTLRVQFIWQSGSGSANQLGLCVFVFNPRVQLFRRSPHLERPAAVDRQRATECGRDGSYQQGGENGERSVRGRPSHQRRSLPPGPPDPFAGQLGLGVVELAYFPDGDISADFLVTLLRGQSAKMLGTIFARRDSSISPGGSAFQPGPGLLRRSGPVPCEHAEPDGFVTSSEDPWPWPLAAGSLWRCKH